MGGDGDDDYFLGLGRGQSYFNNYKPGAFLRIHLGCMFNKQFFMICWML